MDTTRNRSIQSGVIAQELETSLPHLVSTNDEGEKAVNYSGMIPYLIEAVKDLKKENDELRLLIKSILDDK